MTFLYILLGLCCMFIIGLIWGIIEDKQGNSNLEKYKQSSIMEWEKKEVAENKLIETNSILKENINRYKIQIDVAINEINRSIYPDDYKAMICLINITPQMYVKYYEVIQSHAFLKDMNYGKIFIKNALLNDFPIKIVDDIVYMFLYIFNTHQNLKMLKEIVNFDSPLITLLTQNCKQGDIDKCVDEAKRLIKIYENDYR